MFAIFYWWPVGVSGNRICTLQEEITLERVTYSWPWQKTEDSKCSPTYLRDWPCTLLIIITKDNLTGNWWCLRVKAYWQEDGLRVILGMKAFSPWWSPPMIKTLRYNDKHWGGSCEFHYISLCLDQGCKVTSINIWSLSSALTIAATKAPMHGESLLGYHHAMLQDSPLFPCCQHCDTPILLLVVCLVSFGSSAGHWCSMGWVLHGARNIREEEDLLNSRCLYRFCWWVHLCCKWSCSLEFLCFLHHPQYSHVTCIWHSDISIPRTCVNHIINLHQVFPTTQKKRALLLCLGWLGLIIWSFG